MTLRTAHAPNESTIFDFTNSTLVRKRDISKNSYPIRVIQALFCTGMSVIQFFISKTQKDETLNLESLKMFLDLTLRNKGKVETESKKSGNASST